MELLDEYNQFLESVNQAYQTILSIETSFLRQPCVMPVDIASVQEFQHKQDMQMDTLSEKINFQVLLQKLDQIYPNLNEEEKVSTEEKVNQLKSLSNLVVELILQRSGFAGEWLKVLQVDKAEWDKLSREPIPHDQAEENQRLAKICDNISALYAPMQQHLPKVRVSQFIKYTSCLCRKNNKPLSQAFSSFCLTETSNLIIRTSDKTQLDSVVFFCPFLPIAPGTPLIFTYFWRQK